jgi:hypothetical protein
LERSRKSGEGQVLSRRSRIAAIAGVAIVSFGVFLSQISGTGSSSKRSTQESPADGGPTGLLAFVALLDSAGHEIERVDEAPSDGDLDSDKTAFLLAPGKLTAADATTLNDLAADGGLVVVAGDPGDEGLSRLLGSDAQIDGGQPALAAPLAIAPETAGVAGVELADGTAFDSAGGALPIIGASGDVNAVATNVGEGRVVVIADDSAFQNSQIALADNALFALNLAGPEGREVQLVESVRTPPGSGLSALPSAWGWAALGLLVAALALAWASGRRLGPVELQSRALPPPRKAYVDAVAGALVRTRDPGAAVVPLRDAARDRLARKAGLPRDASDVQIREAAKAAGLDPAEVEVVSGQNGEGAMLAAAGALAKLSKRA